MLKKYKKTLIASSLLTLLPIAAGLLLWNRFPERMVTHFGITGEPDGWSSVPFAVFFPPLILLAVQWLCIWITVKDPGNKDRNRKPLGMVLWIVPVVSNLCSGLMYALALGVDLSVETVMIAAMGLLFVVIGNYLPKCKTNSTIGIKVPWTYTSEENWNATHRFGGRVWVIGGLVMMLAAFLPGGLGISLMIIAILALAAIPIAYSYCYYRKQKANGETLSPAPQMTKGGRIGSAVALVLILVFVAVVLFAGKIDFVFQEDYLVIDTNMYSDHVVFYDVIEDVEYREGNVDGVRVGGYGSFRLLMGYFRNEEFGTYVRYTYYDPEACVVVTTADRKLVISGEDAAQTRAIYDALLEKTAG